MKRILLVTMLLLPLVALGQKPKKPVPPVIPEPVPPTVLSVGDLLGNYDLDTLWVNDTASVVRYLEAQPQEYVALTNLCVSLRTKAQKVLASLENDYLFRDSLIWIDTNTVLGDYAIYEYRLRRFAEMMGRYSIKYSRLEQQRIEAEKEAARQRAIEEARRQQEERNRIASDLRSNIERHHRAIINGCDGVGITDKNKLKQLKDLYYSYLMVYNKYDLSEGNATDESIDRLDQLNSFQNDLLENVLGNNSLPYQIENFKNVLKVRCGKEHNDIYRSYSKVFKHTNVPISFADVKEYEEYTGRMRVITNVQQRYIQTIDLRTTISMGNDAIATLYGKKYRDFNAAYRDVLRTIDQLPAFTTNAESLIFIQSLEDFIAAQQRYQDLYPVFEDLTLRTDSIMAQRDFPDIVSAYRDAKEHLRPMPSFREPAGADVYDAQLDEVRSVQQCYLDGLYMRRLINRNDDSLTAGKKVDKVLSSGYRLLRKQASLSPSFYTVERGRTYIEVLRNHIEMQQLCLRILHKQERIKENAKTINDRELPFGNIRKAYSTMEKAYRSYNEITNNEDLRQYDRQSDKIIEMQEAFINLLHSSGADGSNARLKRNSSIEEIKLEIGLQQKEKAQ